MIENYKILKYRNLSFQAYQELGIVPEIEEISCTFSNFHKKNIKLSLKNYSLHTEPSIQQIKNNEINMYPELKNSLYNKKANLWVSRKWVQEFSQLIFNFINNNNLPAPLIIEIHPPFKKVKLQEFFERYTDFENYLIDLYPNINILIENRNSGGNFLLSTSKDYEFFSEQIERRKLRLRLIIDISQLFGKEFKLHGNSFNTINKVFLNLSTVADYIKGIHISGKSHIGNFSSIFGEVTNYFLEKFSEFSCLLRGEIFIVPEILSNKYFKEIISDLRKFKII